MAAEVKPTLLDLPALLLQEVLRLAGAEATACASATCRTLRAVAAHPSLWQAHFVQELQPLRGAHDVGVSAARGLHLNALFWRWKAGAPARTTAYTTGGLRGVTAVAFVGADTLYSAHECGCLVEWNARGDFETSRLDAAHGGTGLNALAACGPAMVATAGVDNAIRLWDVRASPAAPAMQLLDAHSGEVFSVLSLVGDDAAPLLASGGGDEQVRVWDSRFAAEALLELNGCSSSVFSLAHDAAARRLYAGARRDICLFDLRDGAWLTNLQGHALDTYGLALGATRLLSCGDDGRVCSWRRQPPLASEEEEVEEELEPSDEEVITRQGDLGDAVSVICLVGLGREPTAFLAGTWDGDVVLGAFDGARRQRTFGDALLRTDGDHAQRFDAVTALAARDDVVAVGHNSGALRLMRMDEPALT